MRAVVQMSGGVGSWAATRRTVGRYGRDNVTLLFADTLIEDPDLYRFLDEACADVGVPLTRIADGRTPWELFNDEHMIGNTRADLCSRVLKRDLLRKYIEEHFDPADTVVVLGIDWTEIHRFERAEPKWVPWRLEAPMCEPPLFDKPELLEELVRRGIEPPALYKLGFPHNNCGGFCIKAGFSQFQRLLETMPERYAEHEEAEEAFRQRFDKDVSVLRDRSGGTTTPLTLRRFRERIEAKKDPQLFDDWGGCGCALE